VVKVSFLSLSLTIFSAKGATLTDAGLWHRQGVLCKAKMRQIRTQRPKIDLETCRPTQKEHFFLENRYFDQSISIIEFPDQGVTQIEK
jgi:hypothetical protein